MDVQAVFYLIILLGDEITPRNKCIFIFYR